MLRTLNSLLVIGSLIAPPTLATKGIKHVLNDANIRQHKNKFDVTDKNAWVAEYNENGQLMVPVAELAIQELAEKSVETILGGFVALAGHNGPILAQLKQLVDHKKCNVDSLVVIVNPKDNLEKADHKACLGCLADLKAKQVNIFKFKNTDEVAEAKEMALFDFTGSLDVQGVITAMLPVNFLVVGLWGVTSPLDGTMRVLPRKSIPTMIALEMLLELTESKDVVMSVNTPSGRVEDGTWPLGNVHKCTHIVHLFWPLEALKADKDTTTRNFITNSKFLKLIPNGHFIESDIQTIQKSLKTDGYAEVEYAGVQ